MHGIDVMVDDFLNQLLGELPYNMEGDNGGILRILYSKVYSSSIRVFEEQRVLFKKR